MPGLCTYTVHNKYDQHHDPLPSKTIIKRAEEQVGQVMTYGMTSANCEHFVTMLRYGVCISEQMDPKPGDLIEIFQTGYQHWAIYVGDGYVVHLAPANKYASPGSSSIMSVLAERAEVKRELLAVVAGSSKYRVNNKYDSEYSPRPHTKIVRMAEQCVGETMPYSVTSYNCEHFVNDLRYGFKQSKQVDDAVTYGTVAMIGLAVLAAAGLIAAFAVNRNKRQNQ